MKIVLGLIVAVGLVAVSCNKEAGEGGTSSITGSILVNDFNGAGVFVESYPGQDEDVYIIYGTEDQTYDDNFSTSHDGTFRFDYLTPGDYTIFVYSRCDTCAGGQEAIKRTINIADNKTEYTVGTIEISK